MIQSYEYLTLNQLLKKIFFDNASTTPLDVRVLEAMLPFLREDFGNASSIHTFGKRAKVLLEDTRDLIASFINCKPKEIFFTSGGTEAVNSFIKGIAFSQNEKKKIVSSSIEHMAVLESLDYLKERFDYKIELIQPDEYGIINPENINEYLDDETLLLSIMHANNETGVLNDISKIADICREKSVLLHSDTVQSFGKIKLNIKELGVDSASLSAHKIYAPKGVGVVYIRDGVKPDKFIHGGSQERSLRGGTENIPAIAGLKRAVEILKEEMDSDISHYKILRDLLVTELKSISDYIIINSAVENSLPNIFSFSFNKDKIKFDSETLLMKLDIEGIAVSGGSACTSGSLKPSHVMLALGHENDTALSTIRVSFGRFNTTDEVIKFVETLKESVGLL